MDLLEVPLEALAFRYSAALAGFLWAWLAVLTAALSLWRIRSSSGSKPVSLPSDPYPKPAPKPINVPAAAQAEPLLRPVQPPTPSNVGTPNKARFTTYYHDDESCHSGDDVGVESEEEIDAELSYSDSGIGWDMLMPVRRRRGDLGWYCYQDIAVLNGSVVRLWDGPVTTGRRRGWSD